MANKDVLKAFNKWEGAWSKKEIFNIYVMGVLLMGLSWLLVVAYI
jgi:hypothetical protein